VNTVVTWLTGAGVGVVLAAIIAGLFSRRKLSAEATEIITKAASGVVERLEAEVTRVTADNAALRAQVQRQEVALGVHSFWDRQAYDILAQQGIELPPPPPLYVDQPVDK